MRRRRIKRWLIAPVFVLAVAALAALWWPAVDAAAPELAGVRIVAQVATQPGYDRSCASGHQCVFGPAWSDDVRVRWGHDGCDTRNQVLARDLTKVVTKPGTRGCVVLAGVLRDRYSGAVIEFTRAAGNQVPVDHVVALASAWDRGAASWDSQLRRDFANDPDNLTATTRAVNSAKRDKTPATWAPTTRAGACWYVRTYLTIVRRYDLTVTVAEALALVRTLRDCQTTP